jgi:hypothetical protein
MKTSILVSTRKLKGETCYTSKWGLKKLKSVVKMDKNKQKIILAIAVTALIVFTFVLYGEPIIKNNSTSQKHMPVTTTYHVGDEIDGSQYTLVYMNQTVASFLPPVVPPFEHSKPIVQYVLGSNQTLLLGNYLYNVVSYDVAGQTITLHG